MKKKAKSKINKRDVIELALIIVVFAGIYFSGYQAEIFGKVQQVVLKTGVMNAGTLDDSAIKEASYDLILRDEKGHEVDMNTFKGKTIFINIWATWCAPCVAEMPGIQKLYDKTREMDNLVFLMISEDRNFETAKAWVDKKGFDFPIYYRASSLPKVYETGVVPTTFVISPKGEIVVKKEGMANYNTKKFRKTLIDLGESY